MTFDAPLPAPLPAHHDPIVIAASDRALAELGARCPTLEVAAVLTDDGFTVTRTATAASDDRLSSMASTIQALGEAVVRGMKLGDASHVAVGGTRGSLLVRRVGALPLVLVAVFAPARVEDGRIARVVAKHLARELAGPAAT